MYSQSGVGHQDVHQNPEHAQIWEQYRLQQQFGAAQQHHHHQQQQLSASKAGPASSASSHASTYSGSHKNIGSVATPATMEEALQQQHIASLIAQGQVHPAMKFQYEQARSASSGHSPEVLQAQVVQSMAGSMQTAGVPHAMPVYPSMEMMAQMQAAHAQAQAANQSQQQQQHVQQMSALQQQQHAQMAALQQQYAMMQGAMPAYLPVPMITQEQYQAYQSAIQGSHVQQWKMLEQMMQQQPEVMQQVMMAQYVAAQQQAAQQQAAQQQAAQQQAQQGQQPNGSGPAPIHKPVIVNT